MSVLDQPDSKFTGIKEPVGLGRNFIPGPGYTKRQCEADMERDRIDAESDEPRIYPTPRTIIVVCDVCNATMSEGQMIDHVRQAHNGRAKWSTPEEQIERERAKMHKAMGIKAPEPPKEVKCSECDWTDTEAGMLRHVHKAHEGHGTWADKPSEQETTVIKKRGRPKGSKNKSKGS